MTDDEHPEPPLSVGRADPELVWVRADARTAGWGSRLLAAAEQAATDRGCRAITVSSFTFQAPEFYRRQGYVETTRVPDLPFQGHADVWFSKRLG